MAARSALEGLDPPSRERGRRENPVVRPTVRVLPLPRPPDQGPDVLGTGAERPPKAAAGDTPNEASDLVDLRVLKRLARKLGAQHPLRGLLANEPDRIPAEEYAVKAPIWFHLLAAPVD